MIHFRVQEWCEELSVLSMWLWGKSKIIQKKALFCGTFLPHQTVPANTSLITRLQETDSRSHFGVPLAAEDPLFSWLVHLDPPQQVAVDTAWVS